DILRPSRVALWKRGLVGDQLSASGLNEVGLDGPHRVGDAMAPLDQLSNHGEGRVDVAWGSSADHGDVFARAHKNVLSVGGARTSRRSTQVDILARPLADAPARRSRGRQGAEGNGCPHDVNATG